MWSPQCLPNLSFSLKNNSRINGTSAFILYWFFPHVNCINTHNLVMFYIQLIYLGVNENYIWLQGILHQVRPLRSPDLLHWENFSVSVWWPISKGIVGSSPEEVHQFIWWSWCNLSCFTSRRFVGWKYIWNFRWSRWEQSLTVLISS